MPGLAEIEPLVALLVAATLIFGGLVKGLIGIGLPLVTIPLLSHLFSVPLAIAVMSLPILASNALQVGGPMAVKRILARFWPLLIALAGGSLVGARLLVSLEPRILELVLGTAVLVFVAANAVRTELALRPGLEPWLGPPVGLVAGLLGGVSNFFGPPLVMFLVALKLGREAFVSTIGLLFLVGCVPLYAALAAHGVLGRDELIASALALPLVLLGQFLGRRLGDKVPQRRFRQQVLLLLVLIGVSLLYRGLTP